MAVLTGGAASAKIEAWVAALPPVQATLAQEARTLLLALDPGIDERWSYGAPFVYHLGKIFVFLAADQAGFYLGLAFGAQLSDPHGLLTATDRALIRHYRVNAAEDLATEAFFELLGQQLDISFAAAKKGRSGWSGQLDARRKS